MCVCMCMCMCEVFGSMKKGKDYLRRTNGRWKAKIPLKYMDVKMNVVITKKVKRVKKQDNNMTSRAPLRIGRRRSLHAPGATKEEEEEEEVLVSIVGEVQFLLGSMLKAKTREHEMYEIDRQASLMFASNRMRYTTCKFSHRIKIAGTTPELLSPLLVDYALRLREEKLFTEIDAHQNNLIMRMCKSKKLKAELFEQVVIRAPKAIWDQRTIHNQSLLHLVMRYHNSEKVFADCVHHLNQHSEDVIVKVWESKNNHGMTPWQMAMMFRELPLEHYIVDAVPPRLKHDSEYMWNCKSHVNGSLVHIALINIHLNALQRVQYIKEHMSTDNYEMALCEKDALYGETPLMHACSKAQVTEELADALIPTFHSHIESSAEEQAEEEFWCAIKERDVRTKETLRVSLLQLILKHAKRKYDVAKELDIILSRVPRRLKAQLLAHKDARGRDIKQFVDVYNADISKAGHEMVPKVIAVLDAHVNNSNDDDDDEKKATV